mgnify:FL=1
MPDNIFDLAQWGGGPEMRASKAVNRYRQNPTARNAMAAEASLNELGKNKQTEIRQAARV